MEAVISNLSTQALQVLYTADNKGDDSKPKKGALKTSVTEAYKLTTVKVLLESLTVEQLYELAKPLKLEEKAAPVKGKDGKEKPAKPVKSGNILRKRLTEKMVDVGVQSYLEESDLDVIQSIAERIDLETKGSKSALIEAIMGEIEEAGSQLYLESFNDETLRDLAFEMKLMKSATAAPRKAVLIESILENKEVPKKEKKQKKEEVKVSKKKPKLVKGVEYQDVFQHYYLDELLAFAKENKIKTAGAKKDLINRIIAWLDGDKENTVVGARKAPKRRKGGKKKAAAAKKTEGEADETKTESGEEGAEAEAEFQLDLDNLGAHTLVQLKKYCAEEKLEVTGTKKADYIKAIENYNEDDS